GEDIARLRQEGTEVIVVSSGAVALGARHLGRRLSRQKLSESQAAAAIGQIQLAHAYQNVMAAHGLNVAQLLLTIDDTETRRRYLNARDTIFTLLDMGVIPVVNENDTVATSEIRYGDNDRLAARVAQMISADALIILSDVDGLYTADPASDTTARLIEEVEEISPEIEAMAGKPKPMGVGSGGMITKVAAARIALSAGCDVLITSGLTTRPITTYRDSGKGTWFRAEESPLALRKQWIAGTLNPAGVLVVDEGAEHALGNGKSLLPAGVVRVEGKFDRGDAVVLRNEAGEELARGLCAYSSTEAAKIAGHKTGEIEAILGYQGRGELVHRDNMVVF
ncbi:MAG: glutamate 5-kinase, partial [Alphaproteobacteria bacterium]|nr:glutamate 5-kinase [Alphaproteobacteria bacterium]